MVDRPYTRRSSLWPGCMMIVLLWVWGCSTMGTSPEQRQWICDSAADAAVDRQEWELALSQHQALLSQEPHNCLAIYHLGYIRGKLGDRHEETVQYEKAVQCGLRTDDRLFFNLGMAYGEMNLMDQAQSALEQAVALNSQNAENYFGLGLISKWAGQIEKAKAALIKTVDLDSRHWEAHLLLARIYLDEGRLDAAQPHLEHLSAHIPENPDVEELQQIYEDRRVTAFER